MKDELFNELLESVRQGGAILREAADAERTFHVVHERYGKSPGVEAAEPEPEES